MYFFKKAIWVVPAFSLGLTACGGDDTDTTASVPDTTASVPDTTGSVTGDANSPPPPPPGQLNLTAPTVGALSNGYYPVTFTWTSAEYATSYTLCRKDEALPNHCESLGSTPDLSLTLSLGALKSYLADFFVLAENSTDKTPSGYQSLTSSDVKTLITYIKASNAGGGDYFGASVSVSEDGNTLAVGGIAEDSNADGSDANGESNSGAVYVYRFASGRWSKEAIIKASNAGADDYFGYSVSLSEDGNTLAVGAYLEDSNSQVINSGEGDNSASAAGAAYVYRFENDKWTQQAYIKASNAGEGDKFGHSVSLSSNGNILAVGAHLEDSNANRSDANGETDSGAAYVYRFASGRWSEEDIIKASNAGANDYFGNSVSVSGDGNTLAVGAYQEDSNSQVINSGEGDNSAGNSGAAYVYRFDGSNWTEQAYIKALNAGEGDQFGHSVSVSEDGNTLAVGAYYEDSNATNIDGDGNDNNASNAGAAYVYRFNAGNWSQQAYIKASNAESHDYFGLSVSVSGDGNTLAVGAYAEDSNATGINGDGNDNNASNAGAAYVYRFNGSSWSQQAYIKASNAGATDYFGRTVSVSGDGNTLAVGAYAEDSNATGINGDGNNDDVTDSGAVYIY
ncbi:FG-GAP repeat protein [Grimontia marina]|uniref:FG-GAP repeat protein n=1 Tax=Grimontia marina TaxID=646534 RepID=A0A128FGI1_9GAMM|nr:FG-GAP repeat protein [Grimontia marina]CZF85897.1 hypothetical protein GMA8713_03930 [Grimontia marina]